MAAMSPVFHRGAPWVCAAESDAILQGAQQKIAKEFQQIFKTHGGGH
jgi:hypothetical protein